MQKKQHSTGEANSTKQKSNVAATVWQLKQEIPGTHYPMIQADIYNSCNGSANKKNRIPV